MKSVGKRAEYDNTIRLAKAQHSVNHHCPRATFVVHEPGSLTLLECLFDFGDSIVFKRETGTQVKDLRDVVSHYIILSERSPI